MPREAARAATVEGGEGGAAEGAVGAAARREGAGREVEARCLPWKSVNRARMDAAWPSESLRPQRADCEAGGAASQAAVAGAEAPTGAKTSRQCVHRGYCRPGPRLNLHRAPLAECAQLRGGAPARWKLLLLRVRPREPQQAAIEVGAAERAAASAAHLGLHEGRALRTQGDGLQSGSDGRRRLSSHPWCLDEVCAAWQLQLRRTSTIEARIGRGHAPSRVSVEISAPSGVERCRRWAQLRVKAN